MHLLARCTQYANAYASNSLPNVLITTLPNNLSFSLSQFQPVLFSVSCCVIQVPRRHWTCSYCNQPFPRHQRRFDTVAQFTCLDRCALDVCSVRNCRRSLSFSIASATLSVQHSELNRESVSVKKKKRRRKRFLTQHSIQFGTFS